MKKLIKYFLHKITYLTIIFFLLVVFISTVKADLVKPSKSIEPFQVVKIQLNGLMKNDRPTKDHGIKQTWEFAHPNNQKNTGPLDQFISMLKGKTYNVLLNHLDHKIIELKMTEYVAYYEVTILDEDKAYYKFDWIVEKYAKEGPLKDCWLTTVVSAPKLLGSSI